jgi:hypothetical protein
MALSLIHPHRWPPPPNQERAQHPFERQSEPGSNPRSQPKVLPVMRLPVIRVQFCRRIDCASCVNPSFCSVTEPRLAYECAGSDLLTAHPACRSSEPGLNCTTSAGRFWSRIWSALTFAVWKVSPFADDIGNVGGGSEPPPFWAHLFVYRICESAATSLESGRLHSSVIWPSHL